MYFFFVHWRTQEVFYLFESYFLTQEDWTMASKTNCPFYNQNASVFFVCVLGGWTSVLHLCWKSLTNFFFFHFSLQWRFFSTSLLEIVYTIAAVHHGLFLACPLKCHGHTVQNGMLWVESGHDLWKSGSMKSALQTLLWWQVCIGSRSIGIVSALALSV